jgi:group II intron reverse transcriptase/maturase
MRTVLEAYYEPIFRDNSHGFRPNRSCHTALTEIKRTWAGVKWFVEIDIKGCFDNIDHDLLLEIVGQRIRDFRFLKLLRTLLKAGYMEANQRHETLSGAPQGGVISPILANIFLHQLDKYVLQTLKPTFDKGKSRASNPAHSKLRGRKDYARRKGDAEAYQTYRALMKKVPPTDDFDPNFRKLLYIRYADDALIGIIGAKAEAEAIKQQVGEYLATIHLQMSQEKTKITHAATDKASFLGYEIFRMSRKHSRRANGTVQLSVPKTTVHKLLRRYTHHGKGIHRAQLSQAPDEEIISIFDSELRGYYNYYQLAYNVSNRIGHVQYFMWQSLVKTLAHKHKITVAAVVKKYHPPDAQLKNVIAVTRKKDNGQEVTIRYGNFSLTRKVISYEKTDLDPYRPSLNFTEITSRILQTTCELCGVTNVKLVAHHIRRMKDIRRKWNRNEVPRWVLVMHSRNRKTLMVCTDCHYKIHHED